MWSPIMVKLMLLSLFSALRNELQDSTCQLQEPVSSPFRKCHVAIISMHVPLQHPLTLLLLLLTVVERVWKYYWNNRALFCSSPHRSGSF